jgi:hypothetical protein
MGHTRWMLGPPNMLESCEKLLLPRGISVL